MAGEADHELRERVCAGLGPLGIAVDEERNRACDGGSPAAEVHAAGSRIRVMVVPTDEEKGIALQCVAMLARDGAARRTRW